MAAAAKSLSERIPAGCALACFQWSLSRTSHGEGNLDWSRRGIVGAFHSIVMAPSSADHVIITGKSGALMTTNGGKTWFDLGYEYGENSTVYDLAMKTFGPMTRPSTFTHKRKARTNFQVIVPNDVALDPFTNNIAISYDDEGLQISRDGGNWWEWSYWGILFHDAHDARVAVYDPDVKDRLFLGTMGKVDLQRLGQKEIWKLYQSDGVATAEKHCANGQEEQPRVVPVDEYDICIGVAPQISAPRAQKAVKNRPPLNLPPITGCSMFAILLC